MKSSNSRHQGFYLPNVSGCALHGNVPDESVEQVDVWLDDQLHKPIGALYRRNGIAFGP